MRRVSSGGGGKPPKEPEGGKPKTFAEMAGDFLREASVLVMVFGWLDAFGKKDLPSWWGWGIPAIGIVLFVSGGLLEKSKKPT